MHHTYTYLALGDSYTIGEGVARQENFPNQTVKLLAGKLQFQPPTIIAKTGWTTDELKKGIEDFNVAKKYDIVSLMIGVNNQYRGRSQEEYAIQFEGLLKQAIKFAGRNPSRVFVLSIPDWGVTPFAEGKNREKIGKEIDIFNDINRAIAGIYKVNYIDITPGTRDAAIDTTLIAGDNLHPSAKEYQRWAIRLAEGISLQMQSNEKP